MKKDKLLDQYLIDINTYDATPEQKVKRLKRSMIKNLDLLCLRVIALCIGIMTLKVAVEQMIMQLGVYLK